MLSKFRDPAIPTEVKKASKLIISYAVVVILGALWFGISNNFADTKGFVRAIIRFIGMSYIGWWLLSLDKKAWWFAISACSFFLLFGVVGVGLFIFMGVAYDSKFLWMIFNVIFSIYLLSHAVIILSKKTTINYFK